MDETKLISNIWENKGTKTKFTWYPGDNIDKFEPFNQVYGVVFDNEGRILIQKIGDSDWSLAGGTVEEGETAEQTLRRELIEEVDVEIKNPILLGGQRVQFLEGHDPDISKSELDDFYQLRYYCEVDKLLEQTPDPDNGKIHDRLLVLPEFILDYVHWGITGKAIFSGYFSNPCERFYTFM